MERREAGPAGDDGGRPPAAERLRGKPLREATLDSCVEVNESQAHLFLIETFIQYAGLLIRRGSGQLSAL